MARPHRPAGPWSEKPFREALRLAVMDTVKGKPRLRALAESLVNAGLSGDIAAIKEIADRLEGKPAQTLDVAVTDERTVIRAPEPAQTAEEWRASLPKPH